MLLAALGYCFKLLVITIIVIAILNTFLLFILRMVIESFELQVFLNGMVSEVFCCPGNMKINEQLGVDKEVAWVLLQVL